MKVNRLKPYFEKYGSFIEKETLNRKIRNEQVIKELMNMDDYPKVKNWQGFVQALMSQNKDIKLDIEIQLGGLIMFPYSYEFYLEICRNEDIDINNVMSAKEWQEVTSEYKENN